MIFGADISMGVVKCCVNSMWQSSEAFFYLYFLVKPVSLFS